VKVADLVAALSALNPEAEILPIWEGHCPGDFGGLQRAEGDYPRRFTDAAEVIWLLCDNEGDEPAWTLPQKDSP
jgi:hypothetical protein